MRQTLTELRLIASTTQRNLRDDPLGFLLLVGRRFAPRLRGRLLPQSGPGLLPAFGAFVADRREVAAASLRARRRGIRAFDALAARLAVALGAPDAIPARARHDAQILADLAWESGDLSGAVGLLAGSRSLTARRRRSELAVLQSGTSLPVGTSAPARAEARRSGAPRVLHILTNSLPHTRSGYTARTHAILRASQDAGVSVVAATRLGYPTTIGKIGVPAVDTIDGIPYHRLLAPSLPVELDERLAAQVGALDPLIARFAPTWLHTTTDYTNALVTQAAAARHRLPWVYEMRGQLELTWVASRPEALRDAAETSERVRLLRAKEAELAASADAVIVLSRVQADDLVGRGVPRDRITVAPNSIDPTLIERRTSPSDARAALDLPRDGVWAGTVSSLVEYEGLDTFLRALALVREQGVDLRGAIVGDGVSRPGLLALAEELGIADAVAFPGRVSRTDAVQWFEALDIFVVPRQDTPVCRMVTPLKPLEAMALGRPVVASALPALAEIVHEGGLLVTPDDDHAWAATLMDLHGNEAVRRQLGEQGRAAVRSRTWQHVAEQLTRVYREEGIHD